MATKTPFCCVLQDQGKSLGRDSSKCQKQSNFFPPKLFPHIFFRHAKKVIFVREPGFGFGNARTIYLDKFCLIKDYRSKYHGASSKKRKLAFIWTCFSQNNNTISSLFLNPFSPDVWYSYEISEIQRDIVIWKIWVYEILSDHDLWKLP